MEEKQMKISKILAGMSAMALAGSMMTMAASAMEPANASGKTDIQAHKTNMAHNSYAKAKSALRPFPRVYL
mgnify:CR=1 FL=1